MALIIVLELAATGKESTRLFHTLVAGNTGQAEAEGIGDAPATPVTPAATARPAAPTAAAIVTRDHMLLLIGSSSPPALPQRGQAGMAAPGGRLTLR